MWSTLLAIGWGVILLSSFFDAGQNNRRDQRATWFFVAWLSLGLFWFEWWHLVIVFVVAMPLRALYERGYERHRQGHQQLDRQVEEIVSAYTGDAEQAKEFVSGRRQGDR